MEGDIAADRPPLICAAGRGDLAELEALLAAGADMEARDEEDGATAFHWACNSGRLECARALAAAGCDVAAASTEGGTALMLAANKGHPAVVAWLLGEGGAAEMMEARDKDGDTAFLEACGCDEGLTEGQLKCAQALMAAGCDVAAVSSDGSTALIIASIIGRVAVVAWLLGEGGAAGMMEVQNEDGVTAFLVACGEGHLECAQALAASGCDIAATSSEGDTALMLAAHEGHVVVVAWLLGEGGAAGTLEVQDDDGDTAFLSACGEGQLECARALVAAGCDVAAACSDGTTALMRAAGEGNTVVLAWLLGEGGAAGTLEARNNHGCTAFLLACVLGQLECVELLARAGCDMDVETGMHHITGNALEQTADHDAVVVRLRELKAERAAATQRREVEEMTAAYKEFQYNK